MRPVLTVLFALPIPSVVLAQTPAARPADVASPAAIVTALYESVQRAPGATFPWERFRSLFIPNATLIPNLEQTGGTPRVLDVQGFIDWVDANSTIGGQDDKGFAEEEIANVTERYGDIAHVFSTYQKHFWGDTTILGRGINAIQLLQRDGRWWVVSVVWDEETGAGPIPARYLPR